MTAGPSFLTQARRTQSGFSLVELLITLAIMGVVAAIGVGGFGGARQGAEDQKDRRNAQEIASMAAMANAAGASFVVAGDEAATIANLVSGTSPTSGIFKGRVFRLPSLSAASITGAMRFLSLRDMELQYRLDGSE